MMLYTTLNKIRDNHPCEYGWQKLLKHLKKTQADDEPLSFKTILESNGIVDAIWCLRSVEGYESIWTRLGQAKKTNDATERFANGLLCTVNEFNVASDAASDAALAAIEKDFIKMFCAD